MSCDDERFDFLSEKISAPAITINRTDEAIIVDSIKTSLKTGNRGSVITVQITDKTSYADKLSFSIESGKAVAVKHKKKDGKCHQRQRTQRSNIQSPLSDATEDVRI